MLKHRQSILNKSLAYLVQQQQRFYQQSPLMPSSQKSNQQPLQDSYSKKSSSIGAGFIAIVPHAERWIVERLGRYSRLLDSGFHFLIPFVDKVAYKHLIKELPIEISQQTAITKDNVQILIDGVLYVRVIDPVKASYEVEDPFKAVINLAQTTMRAEIGRMTLDTTFSERQVLNQNIVEAIGRVSETWGISVHRYEIKDIQAPVQIRAAMELEAEAERKKRKVILDSEAERQSQENVAMGKKRAVELISEADKVETINVAQGEAYGIQERAKAAAESIRMIAEAISKPNGEKAVAFKIAEDYVKQFGKIAQRTNTVIVPANVNDASSMIAQAMTIFESMKQKTQQQLNSVSKQDALHHMTTQEEKKQ